MPIQHTTNQYLISRGRVYFDPYDASEQLTGEIDLGNCPGLSVTINTEKKDHFSSQTGLRQKDATWLLQVDRTGTLSCDNFSPANASLWLAGQVETKTQAATPVTGELRGVLPGRQYQLGATAANPLGVRNVSAVTVKNEAGTTTYAAGTDYNVDLVKGRLQILEAGAIVAGNIKVSYDKPAKTWKRIKTGQASELRGAIRVVSDNAGATNRDYYMPLCILKPAGELPVIAEEAEYVTMEFELEVLTPANGSAIYLDDAPVAE